MEPRLVVVSGLKMTIAPVPDSRNFGPAWTKHWMSAGLTGLELLSSFSRRLSNSPPKVNSTGSAPRTTSNAVGMSSHCASKWLRAASVSTGGGVGAGGARGIGGGATGAVDGGAVASLGAIPFGDGGTATDGTTIGLSFLVGEPSLREDRKPGFTQPVIARTINVMNIAAAHTKDFRWEDSCSASDSCEVRSNSSLLQPRSGTGAGGRAGSLRSVKAGRVASVGPGNIAVAARGTTTGLPWRAMHASSLFGARMSAGSTAFPMLTALPYSVEPGRQARQRKSAALSVP